MIDGNSRQIQDLSQMYCSVAATSKILLILDYQR